MTSRQISLIPTGQPYGERQETEEQYRAAGIAQTVSTGQTPEAPPPQPVRQATEFDGQVDAFALREPQGGFQLRQTDESRMIGLLDSSPSPVLRDLAQRLRRL